MKILHDKRPRSYVSWIDEYENRIVTKEFKSKDGFVPTHIVMGTSNNSKMALAHEIGHILTAKYHNLNSKDMEYFRVEVMAWRVAKSFIKPSYWKEEYAISSLATYACRKINWKKFRIIEWNCRIR